MSSPPSLALPPLVQRRSPITWRSLTLGLLGVILICALTPYNDYALNNTFLVGNNLPLGAVMLLFLFALLINGPLARFTPRHALSSGELTVAFSMILVSCALPSSGLMRYFPASLLAPFWQARTNATYQALLESLHLPRWLFPSFEGSSVRDWMNDPIVTGYMTRWTRDEPIPYRAWLRPAFTWGIFLFSLYGALLCMVTLVRRQWSENERLPFPLAQIELALVEAPRPGRFLNDHLARRSFWIAFIGVFVLHAWNALWRYWPGYFPPIPVYFDMTRVFTDPPWIYADRKLLDCAVFFSVLGVTYFVSTPVAFSLWFFFIAQQIYRMILGTQTGDPTLYGQRDEHLGAILALTGIILWIGRHHWRLILAQALRGVRPGEDQGRYLSYPTAFWGLVACAAIMCLWLVFAGATVLGAVVAVIILLLLFLIITRIIAETGLMHGQLQVELYKPWQLLASYGLQRPVPVQTFFLTGMLQTVHHDFREVLPVYASHSLKLADQTIFDTDHPRERSAGRKIIVAMLLSLLVGYVVSLGSMLWTEYHYAWPRDAAANFPVNEWGSSINPQWQLMEPAVQYSQSNYHPPHSIAGHIVAGFGITLLLALLRWEYMWWPLHPIGFVMLGTFPSAHLWFSIFLGWLCKVLIVRFGGARLYTNAKPFFLGLIVGESMAAGFWLIMGIALSSLGLPYRPVNIMPG